MSAAKEAEEKERCTAQVWPNDAGYHFRSYRCKRTAKVTRDGKGYCNQHDPIAIKQRNDERERLYNESWERKKAERERRDAEEHFCSGLDTDYLKANTAQTTRAAFAPKLAEIRDSIRRKMYELDNIDPKLGIEDAFEPIAAAIDELMKG